MDPYEVLGIEPGSDAVTVTKAYRRLAREFHPDRYASSQPQVADLAARRMAEINIAHQVLTDPEAARRVRHSEMRRDAATGAAARPPTTVHATSAHTAATGTPARATSSMAGSVADILDEMERGPGGKDDVARATTAQPWTMDGEPPARRRRFRRR